MTELEKNALDHSMHQYYDDRASEYDDWYERRGRYNDPATNAAWHSEVGDLNRNLTRLSATITHNSQARVLDLAAGTGKWTPVLARALPEQGRIIAYDYSPAMLAQTRNRLAELDTEGEFLAKTRFVRGDAYALPFKTNTFDIVFFGFWLSHVPHERITAFFGEVRRVLKPGGQVFIIDSAVEPDRPREEISQRPLNNGATYPVLKIRYSPAQLQTLLEQHFGGSSPHISAKATRRYFVIGVAAKP
jgi:demethylmenaquinone methyltransferase/2-methoxy-6-polyprenyl-1,4-benzoquinol methylase